MATTKAERIEPTLQEFAELGFMDRWGMSKRFAAGKAEACYAIKIPCETGEDYRTGEQRKRLYFGKDWANFIIVSLREGRTLFPAEFKLVSPEELKETDGKVTTLEKFLNKRGLSASGGAVDGEGGVMLKTRFRPGNLRFIHSGNGRDIIVQSSGRLRNRYFKMNHEVFNAFFRPGRPEHVRENASVPSIIPSKA